MDYWFSVTSLGLYRWFSAGLSDHIDSPVKYFEHPLSCQGKRLNRWISSPKGKYRISAIHLSWEDPLELPFILRRVTSC